MKRQFVCTNGKALVVQTKALDSLSVGVLIAFPC